MPEQITILFGLFGGLAMFLFGMNAMSEALQKAAGEKMKSILSFLTRNPVMGALAGALVTAVLQSSSATTVMVIGFVSAGLMGLPQAISVIFGANIGTTMTAQLIAFKISDYIYPIIFIGFLINFLGKKEKTKDIGMVIFSFGLLFEGIQIMSSVMEPLATSPIFTELMGKVKDVPFLGILLGMCMTLVVQSSSATIAVLQSFAAQAGPDGVHSVIGLTGAIPILLGDNIGTTITALLASVGQSKNAKRTAIAHSTFNITGSILFAFLIKPFAAFIAMISPKGPEVQVISRQIANAHTCFNVVMTLIWLPLIPVMVKWVCFVIRGKDQNEEVIGKPRYLDENVINQPVAALYLVSEEVRSSTEKIGKILGLMKQFLADAGTTDPQTVPADGSINEVHQVNKSESNVKGRPGKKEKNRKRKSSFKHDPEAMNQTGFDNELADVKGIQQKTSAYISKMFSVGSLNQNQAEEASGLLSVVSSMERITDRCLEIRDQMVQLRGQKRNFSENAREELERCIAAVQNLFVSSTKMLNPEEDQSGQKGTEGRAAGGRTNKGIDRSADKGTEKEMREMSANEQAKGILKQKNHLRKALKKFNKNHLARIKSGECEPEMTKVYSDILYSIDRMGDNSVAIAEEALDHVRYLLPEQDVPSDTGSENRLIDEA